MKFEILKSIGPLIILNTKRITLEFIAHQDYQQLVEATNNKINFDLRLVTYETLHKK